MKYLNKRTGAIIDSPSPVSGGDWVEYNGKETVIKAPTETKNEEVKKPVEESSTELTKAEIINELEALGIEYDKKAKKEELLTLLMGD